MELKVKEIEKVEMQEVSKVIETNAEATERIGYELRQERRDKERRDAVMDMFFELTGEPMTLKQFEEYDKIFRSRLTLDGYNLKSYIKSLKLPLKLNFKINPIDDFTAFCKREEISIKDGENINNGT